MTEQTTANQHNHEEVEGVDVGVSNGWGDYPLDAVFVRPETRTVAEVVKRIDNKRFVLDPDFQRDFVWSTAKQSKLIESCVMRIPLPVFYVAEAQDGRIIVVDGLQRLSTFARFLRNDLRLSGLANGEGGNLPHPLEGKLFNELPISLQERVQDTQLMMYILDAKAPERARLDIFERVNSGEPLTRQQMRNALYNGPATIWLREAAQGHSFQSATDGTLSSKTMRDREAVNRYCAFKLLGRATYRSGDMDGFLADGLKKLASLTPEGRATLREAFDRAMTINRALFGRHAFRKSLVHKTPGVRAPINISLFEVCAVTMDEEPISTNNAELRHRLHDVVVDLMRDSDFEKSITYSTNSTAAVQKRFSMMEDVIRLTVSP